MPNSKHNAGDLAQMQSLPLMAKIRMTQYRIRQWYEHFNGEVYVSFSGGKDNEKRYKMKSHLQKD
ncbi:hypothetical protein AALA61_16400 [Oscillospiraceae bacterium 42-9]